MRGRPFRGAVRDIFRAAVLFSVGEFLLGTSFAYGARFSFKVFCSTYRIMQYSMGVPFHFILASTLFISSSIRALWERRLSLWRCIILSYFFYILSCNLFGVSSFCYQCHSVSIRLLGLISSPALYLSLGV